MFGAAGFGGHMQPLDRRDFIAALGGTVAPAAAAQPYSTVAQLANQDVPL
jgi:hypothetical protein